MKNVNEDSKIIDIAVLDEHIISLQAISLLVLQNQNFNVLLLCRSIDGLFEELENIDVDILIFNMHENSVRNFNLIAHVKAFNPKVKILVISAVDDEKMISKIIRNGVKGFLGKTSTPNDLTEAVYSLHSEHEYFSGKQGAHTAFNNSDAIKPEIPRLSARHVQILKLMGESLSNREIAEQLFISIRTVETHKNHLMQKLNLKNMVDLIKFGIKNNIIKV
ncbi:MAG: response regulator transcription factor [Bacteroidales bacterium]|jgi:two-component system response regulator NreC|nr:response regulator transcription factor [Bacteroidales bacterium]